MLTPGTLIGDKRTAIHIVIGISELPEYTDMGRTMTSVRLLRAGDARVVEARFERMQPEESWIATAFLEGP